MSASTIISLILAVLKGLNMIFQYAQERKWIGEGEAQAYARGLAQNLRMSNYAKHALEENTSKSDSELDKFLHDLEPEPPDDNFGNMLTIATFFVGGIAFVWSMKVDLKANQAANQVMLDSLNERFIGMQEEMKKLVEILVNQGKHEERMIAMDARLMNQGRRLDETIERFNRFMERDRAGAMRSD
ncbi:hypothetical protein Q9L58_010820 [Maublancomyces gigas]|uniref:Uncharacterized protein n=1 Tax=Discina gigas TaxID=1032678 RepID=A0ABR3G338_9PEZI